LGNSMCTLQELMSNTKKPNRVQNPDQQTSKYPDTRTIWFRLQSEFATIHPLSRTALLLSNAANCRYSSITSKAIYQAEQGLIQITWHKRTRMPLRTNHVLALLTWWSRELATFACAHPPACPWGPNMASKLVGHAIEASGQLVLEEWNILEEKTSRRTRWRCAAAARRGPRDNPKSQTPWALCNRKEKARGAHGPEALSASGLSATPTHQPTQQAKAPKRPADVAFGPALQPVQAWARRTEPGEF
jgi:hypothetical protein